MKTRRRRIEKLKKQEFNMLLKKFIQYYIHAIVSLINEFCVALAKVFSRMAEILRGLLKEKEVK
ncbi:MULTISPECIES: hypothetical protein [Lactobacillales]|uniref:hypothetical protein n=1 Tax=Lactobacillales TaxID=186826 RepID=UPI00026C8681|nr:hypothetical protein [Carnobacterium maltaromaticum]